MMTRGQVARRLGRSIATVRRMEGTLLHPRRDAHGVLRFNAEEVDGVARRMRQGKLGPLPSRALQRPRPEVDEDSDAEEEKDPEELEHRELMRKREAEANARAEVRRAEEERRVQERARLEAEDAAARQRRGMRELTELYRLVGSCSPRELRELSRDPEFSALLSSLEREW